MWLRLAAGGNGRRAIGREQLTPRRRLGRSYVRVLREVAVVRRQFAIRVEILAQRAVH